jgi:melanoma-associated antigen
MPRNYGSVIAWGSSDQLGVVGILYVILALILVNGRVLSDSTRPFSISLTSARS